VQQRPTAFARVRQMARLRQIACLHLAPGLFVKSYLDALRELVEYDGAAFFWLGEHGNITNFLVDRLPAEVCQYHDITDLVMRPLEAGDHPRQGRSRVASSVIRGGEGGDGFFRDLIRVNRARYVLQADLIDKGQRLGRLCLFRTDASGPFKAREMSDLLTAAAYASKALLRPGVPDDAPHTYSSGICFSEDVIVAERDGQIRYCSERARSALLLSTGLQLTPQRIAECELEARKLLARVISAESEQERGEGAALQTLWGRFLLRVHQLRPVAAHHHGAWAITVRHLKPDLLGVLANMAELRLSPKQWQVASLVVAGNSNKQIASLLELSTNTVCYHLKQVFAKLDVHDRTSLAAKLNCGSAMVEVREGQQPPAAAGDSTGTQARIASAPMQGGSRQNAVGSVRRYGD
jgi:DNA-binding CsgD family transcriptional regulator